jgi:hypothetical protein
VRGTLQVSSVGKAMYKLHETEKSIDAIQLGHHEFKENHHRLHCNFVDATEIPTEALQQTSSRMLLHRRAISRQRVTWDKV